MADDLIIYPVLAGIRANQNLTAGRKKLKSRIRLIAIFSGYLIGFTLGCLILIHSTFALALAQTFSAAIGAGVSVSTAGACLGIAAAHMLHQPTMVGVLLGAILMQWLLLVPSLPLLDVIVGSTMLFAFLFTLASKLILRALYRRHYGHSNADGYSWLVEDCDQKSWYDTDKNITLATHYHVDASSIKKFRRVLQTMLKRNKQQSSLIDSLSGERQTRSKAAKDILLALDQPFQHATDSSNAAGVLSLTPGDAVLAPTTASSQLVKILKTIFILNPEPSSYDSASSIDQRFNYNELMRSYSQTHGLFGYFRSAQARYYYNHAHRLRALSQLAQQNDEDDHEFKQLTERFLVADRAAHRPHAATEPGQQDHTVNSTETLTSPGSHTHTSFFA